MPRPPCLAWSKLSAALDTGVEPLSCALSEIDKEIVHSKNMEGRNGVVWIRICAALCREPHLVNVIELATEGDKLLFYVKEKDLRGNLLAIIEPEHLHLKIVCSERCEETAVEIEIIVPISRFEDGLFDR